MWKILGGRWSGHLDLKESLCYNWGKASKVRGHFHPLPLLSHTGLGLGPHLASSAVPLHSEILHYSSVYFASTLAILPNLKVLWAAENGHAPF